MKPDFDDSLDIFGDDQSSEPDIQPNLPTDIEPELDKIEREDHGPNQTSVRLMTADALAARAGEQDIPLVVDGLTVAYFGDVLVIPRAVLAELAEVISRASTGVPVYPVRVKSITSARISDLTDDARPTILSLVEELRKEFS
jgi:hypothetical protein